MFFKVTNPSEKSGSTWFNLDCITHVEEIRSTAEPSRLNLYLTKQAQPVTLTNPGDVAAVIAYLDSKATTAANLGPKVENRDVQHTPPPLRK